MPCLCPPVATSSAALWITDDVLAAAWRRFTHVYNTSSHSQRHRIEGGRRYGSNVPGPLEARRRLAKRRMGLASHSQPQNGSGFGDFGALFGFGTRGATKLDVEKGWKWEAPTTQQRNAAGLEREDSPWGYGWPGGKPKRKEDELEQEPWERFLQLPEAENGEMVEDALSTSSHPDDVHVDPVLASRKAFDKLLADLDGIRELRVDECAGVTAFLQSAADELEASNTVRLLQWLSERDEVTDEVWSLVMEMIVNKIRLGTLPADDCAEMLKTMAHTSRPDTSEYTRMHLLLLSLPRRGLLSEVCATTTRLLLNEESTNDELPPVTDTWLSCLCTFGKRPDSTLVDEIWHGVYEVLSQKYTSSAVFRKYLSELHSDLIAAILLRCWVPHVIATSSCPIPELNDEQDNAVTNITQLLTNRRLTMPRGGVAPGRSTKRIHIPLVDPTTNQRVRGASNIGYKTSGKTGEDDAVLLSFPRSVPTHISEISDYYTTWHDRYLRRHKPHAALVDLIATLALHRLPYATLACDIFLILSYPAELKSTRRVFYAYQLLRELGVAIPSVLGIQLVHYFVSTGILRYAMYVFRSVPGIPLSKVHALPLAIAKHKGRLPSAEVWYALNRVAPEDRSPRPALGATRKPLILSPSHIDLVHRVAFSFSKKEELSTRVAFRRVWECYRFLKDRSAPIGSLMSRALVSAGVIRPLKMGVRVVKEELRYILSIVEAIEGKEVAHQLDRKILEIWQGKVLPDLLKAKRTGVEETATKERPEGPRQWRSFVWARERKMSNQHAHPQDVEDVESGDANRYDPFAFDDDEGGITKSSPSAGADSWDISASSDASVDDLASPAFSASDLTIVQDMAWPEDEFVGASSDPFLQQDTQERRGLGYSGFDSEYHVKPLEGPHTSRNDRSQRRGQRSVANSYHDNALSNTLSASSMDNSRADLEFIASLEEEMRSTASDGPHAEELQVVPASFSESVDEPVESTTHLWHSGEHLESTIQAQYGGEDLESTMHTRLSGELSESTMQTRYAGERLESTMRTQYAGEHLESATNNERAETLAAAAPQTIESRPRAGDPRIQPLLPVRLQYLKDKALRLDAALANHPGGLPPASQETTPARPFPVFWQEKPLFYREASELAKELGSKRTRTASEKSFMSDYNAALFRVCDNAELITTVPTTTVFPFRWGDVKVGRKLGMAVRYNVLARAKAAGRAIDGRERNFVKAVGIANRPHYEQYVRTKGTKTGRKGWAGRVDEE